MKNPNKSSRLILNEMERLAGLSGDELKSYISDLRAALYHERKATNAREFRLREKLNAITKAVTETVTQQKEERSEKENLPPSPPLYGGGVSFECDSRLLQVSQTSSQKGEFIAQHHTNFRSVNLMSR